MALQMTTRKTPAGLPRAEADEILDLALKLEAKAPDDQPLSMDELKRIAFEVGLSGEHIDRAHALLLERRAAQAERRAKRQRITRWALPSLLTALIFTSFFTYLQSTALTVLQGQVERRRAQLANVQNRQLHVEARWQDEPAGSDRTAELSGSENRVSIETRRYDDAVGEYNQSAATLLGRTAARIFGLPRNLPYGRDLAH